MNTASDLVGFVMIAALILYALGAGADFGGGVWDLFARGPRTRQQRELIAHAIGPIWEANHVWLILVIVLAFVAFPPAFAAICIAITPTPPVAHSISTRSPLRMRAISWSATCAVK